MTRNYPKVGKGYARKKAAKNLAFFKLSMKNMCFGDLIKFCKEIFPCLPDMLKIKMSQNFLGHSPIKPFIFLSFIKYLSLIKNVPIFY